MLGVEGDHAAAGGSGSGLDPDAVLQIGAQKAVGIRVPQIRFAEEGQLFNILHAADVIRRDALFLHQVPVVGNVVPYMADLADDFLVLDFQDFFPRSRLNLRLVVPAHK